MPVKRGLDLGLGVDESSRSRMDKSHVQLNLDLGKSFTTARNSILKVSEWPSLVTKGCEIGEMLYYIFGDFHTIFNC